MIVVRRIFSPWSPVVRVQVIGSTPGGKHAVKGWSAASRLTLTVTMPVRPGERRTALARYIGPSASSERLSTQVEYQVGSGLDGAYGRPLLIHRRSGTCLRRAARTTSSSHRSVGSRVTADFGGRSPTG